MNSAANDLETARNLHVQGKLPQAERLYRDILREAPQHAEALRLLAVIMLHNGQVREALDLASRSVAAEPAYADAYVTLGNVNRVMGRSEAAILSYERAVAISPTSVAALNNLATALSDCGRWEEAIVCYDRALSIAPDGPELHFNRANALAVLQKFDDAIKGYDRAIVLKPAFAEAHDNCGNALRGLGRPAEALRYYQAAHAHAPNLAQAHLNEALCRLQLGQYREGWRGFEWRWRTPQSTADQRDFSQPRWTGQEDVSGKTILLYAEQGLGDTIQFCRYVPLVAARGARVLLEVQKPLHTAMESLTGVAGVVSRGDALPAFDYQCPLLSLPLAFGTELVSIPPVQALRARPERISRWRTTLGSARKPRIGLVWSCGTLRKHENRSIPFEAFARIASEAFDFVSLQKDLSDDERSLVAASPSIRHVGDEIGDFADTVAVMEPLDLVISVDTSAAHLAGAMGNPVWILLPANVDWRWLLGRDDSPWYPTARLFRQVVHGDWTQTLEHVRTALTAFAPKLATPGSI